MSIRNLISDMRCNLIISLWIVEATVSVDSFTYMVLNQLPGGGGGNNLLGYFCMPLGGGGGHHNQKHGSI